MSVPHGRVSGLAVAAFGLRSDALFCLDASVNAAAPRTRARQSVEPLMMNSTVTTVPSGTRESAGTLWLSATPCVVS